MPTLRQLRYFVAVAEELHFGRAARRLHMTQPPLSDQIMRLEEDLGMILLNRDRRSVRLTDEGRFFLDEARKILAAVDGAVERLREVHRGFRGTLRIAFVGSSGFVVLPTILKHFRREHPSVKLVLLEMTTAEQQRALPEGTVDVGIGRELSGNPQLVETPVVRESMVVALPSDHPLGQQDVVHLQQLAREDFIFQPRSVGLRYHDRLLALCQEAGFSPRIIQEANLLQTQVNLVAAGLGVSLLPGSVRTLRMPGVVYRELEGADTSTWTILARMRNDTRSLSLRFMEITAGLFHPPSHPSPEP
jgi:DNA-binding transcriptional LysR family regulator